MEIDFLITSFVALFVIIDSIGLTPLFVALTQGMSAKARLNITIRSIGVAFFVLILFALFGEPFWGLWAFPCLRSVLQAAFYCF